MFGITINRTFGFSLCMPNGLSFGWNWTHGDGETTKTLAVIASYHHPMSITWRWAVYYSPPKIIGVRSFLPSYARDANSIDIGLGPLGGVLIVWQRHMFRKLEGKQ